MKKILLAVTIIVIIGIALLAWIILHPEENKNIPADQNVAQIYPALYSFKTLNITEAIENAEIVFTADAILKKNGTELSRTQEGFFCNGARRDLIEYESYSPPEGMLGGWSSTSVIDCKDVYWIYVSAGSGPYLYGPFEKKVGRI